MTLDLRRWSRELLLLLGSGAAYFSPFIPYLYTSQEMDARATEAVRQTLAIPALQWAIAQNALTHLILFTLWYATLTLLGNVTAKCLKQRPLLPRLSILILGWIFLVASNAVWFPNSDYSMAYSAIANMPVATVSGSLLFTCAALGTWRNQTRLRRPIVWGGALASCVAISVAAMLPAWHSTARAKGAQRNIILVGIDSLSAAVLASEQDRFPHLRDLMQHATRYDRAYTLLGRTYPAWETILSGQTPAEHGAIFNLRSLSHVKTQGLVTQHLQALGYRTVFAIDERRFNNMDERFGFNAVVGPKVGALDFAIQQFNDSPLTNLLLQTPLGEWALPFSYLNVASYNNYDASGFVEHAVKETQGADKLFLAIHFLSGHYPFISRHTSVQVPDANRFRAHHVEAVIAVDGQIGQLMDGLRQSGQLDDALVVVLSDHGEGLGDIEAHTQMNGRDFSVSGYGHGADVLSDHQSRIVLGTIQFKDGHPVSAPALRHEQVSLMDLRAAIEGFAANGRIDLQPAQACIPVETGIRFSNAANYATLDPKKLAAQGLNYYETDAHGRMQLREDRLHELVATKDVGWRCKDRLTFFRKADGKFHAYRLENDGQDPIEIPPAAADIEKIKAYQQRLMLVAGGSAE